MERTRDPLPTLQCPQNRQLWWRRFNDLGRYHVGKHVFERGSVTGVRYRDEVLKPYVRIFKGACGPQFILMDNNVRLHRALMVDEFLVSEDIRRMD
ncbi:DDE_3 domain-containing protein [Trichonephila clavipes]|nr:DDE_3 domain-containing protein [Trichonephila clavipes]